MFSCKESDWVFLHFYCTSNLIAVELPQLRLLFSLYVDFPPTTSARKNADFQAIQQFVAKFPQRIVTFPKQK